jgi:hypothetical protein
MMEPETMITFINTAGFPAAAFAAMYYLVAKAIAGNTKALQELEKAITMLCAKE